jgi:hypothetical protein
MMSFVATVQLRVHPGQRFGKQWLAAVERWVEQLAAAQRQQQLQRDLEASAAAGPTGGALLTQASLPAAADLAPTPGEPVDLDDDDYDNDSADSQTDDSSQDGLGNPDQDGSTDSSPGADADSAATGARGVPPQHHALNEDVADRLSSCSSDASSDNGYDLVSYLGRMSLGDRGGPPAGAVASSGGRLTGPMNSRSHRGRQCSSGQQPAGRRRVAAAMAGPGTADCDSSSSWVTDDDSYDSDRESDRLAADAALTAAEERELLCEGPSPQLPGDSTPPARSPPGPPASRGENAQQQQQPHPAGDQQQEQRERRRERRQQKRQQKQQQQQGSQQVLVSLRLERQGLGDKEVGSREGRGPLRAA